jgi:hypothetical protein
MIATEIFEVRFDWKMSWVVEWGCMIQWNKVIDFDGEVLFK